MPWEVPITVGDQTYPVQFNTEAEPTQADIDEAVSQILRNASTASGAEEVEDTGQGRVTSALANIGRGALSVIPGAIGGVGYLAEPVIGPGLKNLGEGIESDIESLLPVNPAYQDDFSQKAAGAIGQAGGMLLTGGIAGTLGKGAAVARGLGAAEAAAAGTQVAGRTLLGSGFLSGSREGGQAAEQYGMEGTSAYTRALLGGAIEGATEKYLFGLGSEVAPIGRVLGLGGEAKGLGGFLARAAGTEAGEEAVAQGAGNVATKGLAPEGVETPGIGSGIGEAAALGGVAGLTFGAATGLLPSGKTSETGTPEADRTFTVESGEMPLPEVLRNLNKKVDAAVSANAGVLPATKAVLEGLQGGLTDVGEVEGDVRQGLPIRRGIASPGQEGVTDMGTAEGDVLSLVPKKVSAAPVPQQVEADFFTTPGKFYRVIVGDEAFQDIINTGEVRTNAGSKVAEGATLAQRLAARPTAFPSFSKDSAAMSYAGENPNHYIVVSESPSIKPSTRGRHSPGKTFFPTDEQGNHLKSLPASEAVVYKHVGNGKYERVFLGKNVAPETATSPTAPAAPAVEEAVVTETPAQEESPAAPPAEPTDATVGSQPTPRGVGSPPVVTDEPQTPAPAIQPVSAAETPVATEPETPLPKTEKVVAPKAEMEQGAGMTQRDTSKPEQMTPEEFTSSERDKELPKNYVLSDNNGNFVTQEKDGSYKVWRLAGTHATLAGTVGRFQDGSGLDRAQRRLQEVSAEMHEEKLGAGLRQRKPVSAAAVDAYGITLPEGYVRQGDLYVFAPEAPAAPAAPAPKAEPERIVSERKAEATKKVFENLQKALSAGGEFQIPGNPPLRITSKNKDQFSLNSRGELVFTKGRKGGVISVADVAVIGAQVGAPFDFLSLYENLPEQETIKESDALAVAQSDGGAAFERLKESLGDVNQAVQEIEILTGMDMFSVWPVVIETVADSKAVSKGSWVDTDAKAALLRSLYKEASEMPESKKRADALEQILMASNINQSNRYLIKRKRILRPEAPPTQTKPEDEAKSQAQVKETSRTPSVEGQPSQTRPEVQAQEGAAQRGREGEEVRAEKAAPGVEPGAAAEKEAYRRRIGKLLGDDVRKEGTPSRVEMLDEAQELWATEKEYRFKKLVDLRDDIALLIQTKFDSNPYVSTKLAEELIEGKPNIVSTIASLEPIRQSEIESIGSRPSVLVGLGYERGERSVYRHPKYVTPSVEASKTKKALAERLAGKEPSDFSLKKQWNKRVGEYMKRSKADLEELLSDRIAQEQKETVRAQKIKEWTDYLQATLPETDTKWRSSLTSVAEQNGVPDWTAMMDNKKGEEVYRLASRLADRGASIPTKTPAAPEFGSANTIFTKEKAEEARKTLRRKLGQANIPAFDPELFSAATQYAGFLIEGGVRKFGDFSTRMVSEFGEAVRPFLKGVYNGVRDITALEGMDDAATVDKGLVETPAAPAKVQPKEPTEPVETPEQIGIANAVVDLARENLGLPPIERPVQDIYGDDQVWSDAEAAMSAEPDRARYLVKSLIDTPRQASTLETAILLRETVARTARLQQASIELVNAAPENKEMARQKYDDAVMSLTEVQEASALAGAEQGRAFRARRFLADLNYSLAVMTTTLQGAHQRKLTDTEVAEVMAESEKINKALKEVNDLKDSAGAVAEEESIFAEAVKEAQAEARLNAKETISTAKSEIKAGKSVRGVINEKRDAARARLRKRGGSLNVGLNPADLVDYAIIAASYIAEGAVTLKDVTVKMVKEFGAAIEQHMPKIFSEAQVLKSELDNVAVEEPSEAPEKPRGKKPAIEQLREDGEISGRLVYEMVKEKVKSGLTTLDEVFKAITADVQTVVPEITERELRDLFSGYGKVKFPSQEELPKKVRELRRLAQLASAIEDAKNKIAPLRSGPQRDEATLAVREAQKELKRIMKEQGIERAPGPRALKSALDAAKTRLRNQIEELEKQVKERKRAPADKRDIVYDQETKDLIAKRDALQATLEEIDPPQPLTAQELIKKALKDLDKTIAELEKKVKERDISKPATTETPITAQIQVKRDQRDALRKQLKDIRIEIEGEPYLTQEQVNERAERNLSRQIDELQRQIDEKDFEQAKGQKPENTSAIIRLKARRDTLREQRDILKEQTLGKKVKSEAERIDIAVKALEKSIDSLNERIRKGDVMPLKKPDLVGHNERVKSLREQREGLRKTVREMRKAQENAAKDLEAEQLKRDRQYLESQIKSYQKKLASGDFRPRPKKAKEYSDKLADKTLQLQKLKEEWAEKVFIAQLNSRGKAAKAYDFGKQVLHTSRAVLTSFDVSAVFRQGGFIALGNPVRAFRNLKPMFESLASAQAAQRAKDDIENRTNFKLYRQSKLYLADFNQLNLNQQEETFMSRWLNKIPKVLGGGIIRGSQRAYVTFLNRMRADTFDAMLASLQKGPEPTTEEVNAIANYINIATGRGDLGKFQQAGEALNTVFFAPRLVASRFQILGGYPYFKSSGRTKNLVLREYTKFLTGAALVYAIGRALQDDEDEPVELDPRSSDFLKLRYGDTRVDPLGGLIQASVLLSRLATGEKKQLSGKVVPIRDEYRLLNLFRERPRRNKVGYGADNTFDVGANFLRSKFSPSFGAAVDLLTGETVVGEKTTPTEVGYKMVMPITFGEAAETLEAQGMSKGAALTIISLFGMGVQTYD